MIPYIILFVIIMFLTIIAQNTYNKNKRVSIFISVICVLILSLFAAVRRLDVGTDISIYGEKYFNYCSRFPSFISYITLLKTEKGYLALNYFVYKIWNNIHFFFFVLQFIMASCVYIIAYREKEKGTMWMIVLAYLCLWYNSSFNIIRQSVSIAILLYSYKFIEEKNYAKYIIAVVIAFFFHKSSIICLSIPLLNVISKSKGKNFYIVLIVLALAYLYSSLDTILYIVSNFLPLLNKYLRYLDTNELIPNINWKYAMFKLVMLIGILLFSKKTKDKDSNNLLIIFAILDFVLYCSSSVIKYGYRLSYFFLPHLIILCPRIDMMLKGYQGRSAYRFFIVIFFILYWIFRYVVVGYDGTIPYAFFWR